MNILMFGRGVISTQYGWALEKAGNRVIFYVRKGRMADYGNTVDLNIFDTRKSMFKRILVQWQILMTEEIEVAHNYDLIIVSVQHYQLPNVIDVLKDKVGNATILFFNNFWEVKKKMIDILPQDQIVWGFPRAGGGFGKNGVLNGTLFVNFLIGTFGTPLTERAIQVTKTFKAVGFKPTINYNFRSYLFSHFVFNAALHLENLSQADNIASLDNMKTVQYWKNVKLNYNELLPLLKIRTIDIKANNELQLFRLPSFLLVFMMRILLRFVPAIKQIYTAHSNIEELKSYCRDVLSTANTLKIKLPRFEEHKDLFQ